MKIYKKLFLFAVLVLGAVGVCGAYKYFYPIAYEKGKTDSFYCKITYGIWVDGYGCHDKSSDIARVR